MPGVTQIIQMRNQQRAVDNKNPLLRVGLVLACLFSLSAAIGGFFFALSYVFLTHDLPSIEALPGLLDYPSGQFLTPTRLYDRSGEHLLFTFENYASGGRKYLPLSPSNNSGLIENQEVLPSNLITATIAAIDPGFWDHPGFEIDKIFGQNKPSIAQRLSLEMLLGDEPSGLRRDWRSRLLAQQITERFGRRKLLEWYLNHANYGLRAHGAAAASQVYFDKPAGELTLAEAALLAAAGENPAANIYSDPDEAKRRKDQIIQEALRLQMIDPQSGIDAFRSEPEMIGQPGLAEEFSSLAEQVSLSFAQLAIDQVSSLITEDGLERGGLRILTTLDF